MPDISSAIDKPSWWRAFDWPLAMVLSLAAVLRCIYVGMFHLIRDEAVFLIPAFRLARHGQWTWASWNTSSWALLRTHSPLSVYLAAIPYLFSPDARLGRIWLASLAVLAVAIMYWTVKRYFGPTAAMISGLLLAAQAAAVDWSRFVWNPNYGQPFIAGWIFMGLLGYSENKGWARVLHWLALSLAVQTHPSHMLLAPLSLGLVLLNWIRHKAGRKALVRATLLGWGLFAASLIPWAIGLISENPSLLSPQGLSQATAHVTRPVQHLDLDYLVHAATEFANVTGSTNRRLALNLFTDSGMWLAKEAPGSWLPPAWIELIFETQAVLTFAALLMTLVKGARHPLHLPTLLMALVGLWPFTGFLISRVSVRPYYLIAVIFGAVPCLSIVLADFAGRSRWSRRLMFCVVGVFVAAQSWLTIATMREHYLFGNAGRFDAPLDTFLSVVNEWNAVRGDGEMIILAETTEDVRRVPYTHENYWSVVTEGYPARIILMAPRQGVPIPAGGALVASTYGGETIPALFGEGNTSGVLANGEPMYRWIVVSSVSDVSLILYPARFSLFANGARIVGISAKQDPQPGAGWSVVLIWNVERTDVADNYSFSVRLVDEHGNRFGQVDGLSLDGDLWRVGDTVFNRFTVPVSADYLGGPLRVQLLAYKTDTIPVVDEGGTPIASEMTLVPDDAVTDDLAWFEYHPAGRYAALTSHQYFARLNDQIDLLGFIVPQTSARSGESIPVTLYWKAAHMPTTNFHVFVHLRDANGNLVGQSDKANPADSPTSHWTTAQYLADDHSLVIAPNTPPGSYQLFVGLWEESTGRATAYNESSTLLGDSVPLGIFVTVQPQ